MPRLNGKVPAYRRHKASGQALVTLDGRDHYLGPHGSETSLRQYDRLVGEWLAGGRHCPAPEAAVCGVLVDQLVLAFWNHAKSYYRKADGSAASELGTFKQILRVLRRLYGKTPVAEFRPTGFQGAAHSPRHAQLVAGLHQCPDEPPEKCLPLGRGERAGTRRHLPGSARGERTARRALRPQGK